MIIQPIAVRPSKSDNVKFEIVAGERWLAAQRAGLHEIPVTILDLSDAESLKLPLLKIFSEMILTQSKRLEVIR